jgi:hypothetical protein
VQCELATFGPEPENPYCDTSESPGHWCVRCSWREKTYALRRREYELRLALASTLLGELPGYPSISHKPVPGMTSRTGMLAGTFNGGPCYAVETARGFVEKVTLEGNDWVYHADALLAAAPITKVDVTSEPTVTFGASTRRRWDLSPTGRYEVAVTWDATGVDGGPRRFGLSCSVSNMDIRDGHEGEILERFDHRVEAARTPLGYLRARWPKVTFGRGGMLGAWYQMNEDIPTAVIQDRYTDHARETDRIALRG